MDKFESQIVEYVADLEYKDLTRDAIEAAKERLGSCDLWFHIQHRGSG